MITLGMQVLHAYKACHAELFGDIRAPKLVIEEGVTFVGKTEVNPNKVAPLAPPSRGTEPEPCAEDSRWVTRKSTTGGAAAAHGGTGRCCAARRGPKDHCRATRADRLARDGTARDLIESRNCLAPRDLHEPCGCGPAQPSVTTGRTRPARGCGCSGDTPRVGGKASAAKGHPAGNRSAERRDAQEPHRAACATLGAVEQGQPNEAL